MKVYVTYFFFKIIFFSIFFCVVFMFVVSGAKLRCASVFNVFSVVCIAFLKNLVAFVFYILNNSQIIVFFF